MIRLHAATRCGAMRLCPHRRSNRLWCVCVRRTNEGRAANSASAPFLTRKRLDETVVDLCVRPVPPEIGMRCAARLLWVGFADGAGGVVAGM